MPRREVSPFSPALRDDGQPAFDEAWQAQVLALAFGLADRGAFSAGDWSAAIGAELAAAASRGERDDLYTYYSAALTALETLLRGHASVTAPELGKRVEAWRSAYLATPHGKPVVLGAGNTHTD